MSDKPYEVFQLAKWAEAHAARNIERVEFYKGKSKSEQREQYAEHHQGWADKFAEVSEALSLLDSILRFQLIPYSERIDNPLYVGDTSIKPSGYLWGMEANWDNLSPEKLEDYFSYIRDCKSRYLAHQENKLDTPE